MELSEDQRRRIDTEVERTLGCLAGMEDIEPGPQFYVEVRRRIAAGEQAGAGTVRWWPRLLRPAPALLLIMLLCNAITAWVVLAQSSGLEVDHRQAMIDAVSRDYSLNSGWPLMTGEGE